MVSESRFDTNSMYENQPISKTFQYKKFTKPMLERKRRARINRCLEELKELMIMVLQAEGENVSKLEKADILEMTVSHLHKLNRQHEQSTKSDSTYADRFRAGFSQCAAEVTSYLTALSSASTCDNSSIAKVLQHLGSCVKTLESSYDKILEKKTQSTHRFQFVTSSSSPILRKIQQPLIVQSHNSSNVYLWRPW